MADLASDHNYSKMETSTVDIKTETDVTNNVSDGSAERTPEDETNSEVAEQFRFDPSEQVYVDSIKQAPDEELSDIQMKIEKDNQPNESNNLETSADQSARSSPTLNAKRSLVNIYSSEDEPLNDREAKHMKTTDQQPSEEQPANQSPGNYSFEIELQDHSDHESIFSKRTVLSVASTRKSPSFIESTNSSRSASRSSKSRSSRRSSASSESGESSATGSSSDRESGMLTDEESQCSSSSQARSSDNESRKSTDKESRRSSDKRSRTRREARRSSEKQSRRPSGSRGSDRESKRSIKNERKRPSSRRESRERQRSTSGNSRKRTKTVEHESRRNERSRRRSQRSRSGHSDRSREPLQHFSLNSNSNITTFADLNISAGIQRRLMAMSVCEPNAIQKLVLPALLDPRVDRNILIQSKPLSGKKLLYLIAALERIDYKLEQPQVLIVASSAEMCGVIVEMARALRDETRIRVGYLLRDFDRKGLRMSDHIVVGTMPTMLACLRKDRILNAKFVRLMIFHNLDWLTSCRKDLVRVLSIEDKLSSDCQRVYVSACFGSRVSRLVRNHINSNLIRFDDFPEEDLTRNILQFYVRCCRKRPNYKTLLKVLKNTLFEQVIVYVDGVFKAQDIAKALERDGYNAIAITTSTTCEDRLEIIASFKRNRRGVLVLNYPITNGVDLGANLSMVINYDLRTDQGFSHVDYYHRIAKVGRQQRPGFVVNIVNRSRTVTYLEDHLSIRMIKLDC